MATGEAGILIVQEYFYYIELNGRFLLSQEFSINNPASYYGFYNRIDCKANKMSISRTFLVIALPRLLIIVFFLLILAILTAEHKGHLTTIDVNSLFVFVGMIGVAQLLPTH